MLEIEYSKIILIKGTFTFAVQCFLEIFCLVNNGTENIIDIFLLIQRNHHHISE